MTHHPLIRFLPALALIGCTQFPELDGTVRPELENAPYPELVPLEPILASAQSIQVDPVQTESSLTARLAGLRARADVMRGAVISDAEKKRLGQGVSDR